MTMKYNAAALLELSQELDGYKTTLMSQASQLNDAAKSLMQAWEGNEGFVAFKQLMDAWSQEFGSETDAENGTTIGTVRSLSQAVEQALANATGADRRVVSGFGGG